MPVSFPELAFIISTFLWLMLDEVMVIRWLCGGYSIYNPQKISNFRNFVPSKNFNQIFYGTTTDI